MKDNMQLKTGIIGLIYQSEDFLSPSVSLQFFIAGKDPTVSQAMQLKCLKQFEIADCYFQEG